MPYRHIEIPPGLPAAVDEAARNADMYLHDVYGMFQLPLDSVVEGGGCNFSIALILLCVIDGVSCHIYPRGAPGDEGQRFKRLVRDKLYWPINNSPWIDKGEAAKFLWAELRNPLAHSLAADQPSRARRSGHDEPNIGKWGEIPPERRNIDEIDGLAAWSDDWPTGYVVTNAEGKPCIKLCGAAFYWAVKRMIQTLVNDGRDDGRSESS